MTEQEEILEEMVYAACAAHEHYCKGFNKEGINEIREALRPFVKHAYKDLSFKESNEQEFHETLCAPILTWNAFKEEKECE